MPPGSNKQLLLLTAAAPLQKRPRRQVPVSEAEPGTDGFVVYSDHSVDLGESVGTEESKESVEIYQAGGTICDVCRKIDFDAIFRSRKNVGKPPRRVRGQRADRTLSLFPPWRDPDGPGDCVLCRFLFQSRALCPPELFWYPVYELLVVRAKAEFGALRCGGIADSAALFVRARPNYRHLETEKRIILEISQQPNAFAARQITPLVNTSLISEWLMFCDNHHPDCKEPSLSAPQGFRVLDCAARTIVEWETVVGPEKQYLALSYVWGGGTVQPSVSSGALPDPLPRTIEDAVSFARSIGYRYLWVDRYCIPQDDAEAKHVQLQSMDVIYQHAYLTIIAAAGNDPEYGLPGIGDNVRNAQPHIRFGSRTLACITYADYGILQSTWNTRGWTYQEGLLSRKKLVFTDTQVYYQCNGMHCLESLRAPLELLHTQNKTRMRDEVDISRVFPHRTVGKQWYALEHRITEYLNRSLTYDSDILNAFKGILAAHERRFSASTRILAGIPIPVNFLSRTHTESVFPILYGLGEGLSWSFDEGNEETCISKLQRRSAFPSWTWLGWKQLKPIPIALGDHQAGVLTNAIAEYADGELLAWDDDANRATIFDRGWADNMPRFLRISGPALDVEVCMDGELTDTVGLMCPRYNEEDPRRRSWCDISSWTWHQYNQTSMFPVPFTLLLLGFGSKNRVELLVLHKPPSWDYYERIDIVSYDWGCFGRVFTSAVRDTLKDWPIREVRIG